MEILRFATKTISAAASAAALAIPSVFDRSRSSAAPIAAINAPAGAAYATLGKPFHVVPGQRTQLNMMGTPFDIYLPPMAMGDVVALNPNADIQVGFGAFAQNQITQLFANDPATAQPGQIPGWG